MSVPATLIKELRQSTGAGILACREALEKADGDLEKAKLWLRQRGLEEAKKRAERDTQNGILDLYSHGAGRVGVMVEVNCETDFVARTEGFRTFAHEIALQIAATSPKWVKAEDVPAEAMSERQELARQQALQEGKPEKVIERIVEGRLKKFFEETCLLQQAYIRDEGKTVGELLQEIIASTGENIAIRRFERWEVGEKLD